MELSQVSTNLYSTWVWVRVRKSFITSTSWVWVRVGAWSTIWNMSTCTYSRRFYNLWACSLWRVIFENLVMYIRKSCDIYVYSIILIYIRKSWCIFEKSWCIFEKSWCISIRKILMYIRKILMYILKSW